ncbi:MAG: class I SAM-dependent methyltransferase [Sphingomicrobium sp.]
MALSETSTSVRYTYEFVNANLGDYRRVLEVGCGHGELAALLADSGRDILAIDIELAAIASARALQVDAHAMSWPTQMSGTFDAVLFTRSLHHIADLTGAVAAAKDVLSPGGKSSLKIFDPREAQPDHKHGSAVCARYWQMEVPWQIPPSCTN